MSRVIAHMDLDAFFASVEQRDRPEYRGRPVVVGAQPGQRGVVAAASYEARRFGIHSAMPIGEAQRRCPDAVYLRPDLARYRQVSRQVFAVLATVTPVVEAASIDEAYLDLTGLEKLLGAPRQIGALIRQRIFAATGLTASVGIGPNRLVAKLASEHCKPDGLLVLGAGAVAAFLDPMPVSNLRGAGRSTCRKLAALGIGTVAELRRFDLDTLGRSVGARLAASLHRQSLGLASDAVVPDRQRKSISKERTFGQDVTDTAALRDSLRELAAGVARTARAEGLAGRVVTLKVRYPDFDTRTRRRQLAKATQDERVLLRTAWALWSQAALPHRPVRLIGVSLSHWERDAGQADLFAAAPGGSRDQRVLTALDQVTRRFGSGKLQLGLSPDPED